MFCDIHNYEDESDESPGCRHCLKDENQKLRELLSDAHVFLKNPKAMKMDGTRLIDCSQRIYEYFQGIE